MGTKIVIPESRHGDEDENHSYSIPILHKMSFMGTEAPPT